MTAYPTRFKLVWHLPGSSGYLLTDCNQRKVRPAVVHDPALAPQFTFKGTHNRSAAAGLRAELGSAGIAVMRSSPTRLVSELADL